MIRPLKSRFEGFYYDGQSPLRTPAEVEFAQDVLRITLPEDVVHCWSYGQVRIAGDGAFDEPVRLEREGGAVGEYVSVHSGEFLESLRQHAAHLRERDSILDRLPAEGWPAVIMSCLGIAVISLILYVWGIRWAAETAANYTPVSIEERLGRAAANILAPQSERCSDPIREPLLAAILDRLAEAAGSPYRFRMIYVRNSMINAFAAPGGYIIVFDGLLKRTETPEEFAGVLAHEIQHVLRRHSTRALARELSGRTLLSLMAVDVAGTPAALEAGAALVNLQHRRSDEEEADSDSIPLLTKAKVDTRGLASFLRRLDAMFGSFEPPTYLSSHPSTLDRAARLNEAAQKSPASTEPLMTLTEWEDARAVCGE